MIVSQRKKKRRFFSGSIQAAFCFIVVGGLWAWNQSLFADKDTPTSSIMQLASDQEKLNEMVRSKSDVISKAARIPGGYPALSSLLEVAPDSQETSKISLRIVGDVQFLLD